MFTDESHARKKSLFRATSLMFAAALLAPVLGRADGGGSGNLRSLKTEPIPLPAALGDYVADQNAAIRLGKALFWDMQAGSDGKTACATCHFQAGVRSEERRVGKECRL